MFPVTVMTVVSAVTTEATEVTTTVVAAFSGLMIVMKDVGLETSCCNAASRREDTEVSGE